MKEVVKSSNNNGATLTVEELAKDSESGFVVYRHISTPGFLGEKHGHTDFEWVYVAEGEMKDEFGSYPKVTFMINEKGAVHCSYTETGCTLLVISRGGHTPVGKQGGE